MTSLTWKKKDCRYKIMILLRLEADTMKTTTDEPLLIHRDAADNINEHVLKLYCTLHPTLYTATSQLQIMSMLKLQNQVLSLCHAGERRGEGCWPVACLCSHMHFALASLQEKCYSGSVSLGVSMRVCYCMSRGVSFKNNEKSKWTWCSQGGRVGFKFLGTGSRVQKR